MNQKESRFAAALAMSALDDIPTPSSNAKNIVALLKEHGTVSGYQLSDGRTVSKEEGVALARNGEIAGVGIAHRKGTEYLKSLPDGTEDNNLSHLPTISGKSSER
ncbi:MAG: DUF3892 domain-containing protein [Lachnospiraceae bacterium]|nr:DUF3892 domain-containing protein [Lachnospiraceae bacterium]MBP3458554.1 DUF3892 domain-containing protein [Lachnospiraceae bacterium]